MLPYDMIQLAIAVFTTVLLLCIFVMLTYGRLFIQDYKRNKTLRFTQEETKQIRIEIDNFRRKEARVYQVEIHSLISHFNEIAVGINKELYDETYVRMVLGHEMMGFYREYRKDATDYVFYDEDAFLPLELLLKRWDSDKFSYRLRNNRRIL